MNKKELFKIDNEALTTAELSADTEATGQAVIDEIARQNHAHDETLPEDLEGQLRELHKRPSLRSFLARMPTPASLFESVAEETGLMLTSEHCKIISATLRAMLEFVDGETAAVREAAASETPVESAPQRDPHKAEGFTVEDLLSVERTAALELQIKCDAAGIPRQDEERKGWWTIVPSERVLRLLRRYEIGHESVKPKSLDVDSPKEPFRLHPGLGVEAQKIVDEHASDTDANPAAAECLLTCPNRLVATLKFGARAWPTANLDVERLAQDLHEAERESQRAIVGQVINEEILGWNEITEGPRERCRDKARFLLERYLVLPFTKPA